MRIIASIKTLWTLILTHRLHQLNDICKLHIKSEDARRNAPSPNNKAEPIFQKTQNPYTSTTAQHQLHAPIHTRTIKKEPPEPAEPTPTPPSYAYASDADANKTL